MRFIIVISIVFLLLCVIAEASKIPQLNILFITLDTTRADRIGCYGYEKIKTPNIELVQH